MIVSRAMLVRAAAILAASAALGGSLTGTEQSTKLYTPADPAAGGGIRLRLMTAAKPMGVFALNQADANRCYPGASDSGGWLFKGLPVGKYDLVAIFADRFYEGLVLARDTNTLTSADQVSITKIIDASVPFFDTKLIHRMAGVTGRAGKASIVFQEVRTRPLTLQSGEERDDIQIRSLKMGFLEDVNIGWQLVNTREIMRIEVGGPMPKGLIAHSFVKALGNIRVTDSIKDLGDVRLE
jgi:hypothetical protein